MKSAKLINSKIEILNIEKPKLTTTGAIIKVLGCGLCGSDLVKIKHATKENEDKIVLGHEVVGVIEELNSKNGNFKIGDIVALGHHYPCFNCEYCKNKSYSMCKTFKTSNIFPCGFSEYIKVDENHLKYTVYKMDSSLKDDEKAFLEPLSCCLRAIRRAGFEYQNNENNKFNSLVIGLGSIGLLMLKGLKAFDVNAYGFDISDERMDLAKNHGFDFDKDKKYDCVFLTAGSSKAIKTALDNVIDGGKIIVFSSVENDISGFTNNEIYYRELSIISSYSPAIEDIKLSSELLNSKKINVSNLSTCYQLDNLDKAVEDSFNNKVFKAYIRI
ncbi:MAG: alcohol dehydrogenase catalytic domain-containing protein [Candidatus Gastranaerophilales bacterium]|nr:alcohol dehydrogenase catalytic domain-containing protein [Candidatus Gastranaerophilales bacterium]